MNESGHACNGDVTVAAGPETKSRGQGDKPAAVSRAPFDRGAAFRKITSHIDLSPSHRAELEALARGRSQPHRVVVRSGIVLRAADGVPLATIARELRIARSTVRRWCHRFVEGGVAAILTEAPGRGRRPGLNRRV